MIQLGVTQILKRQVPHPVQRRVDCDRAGLYLFKQDAQLVLVHSKLQVVTDHHVILSPSFRLYFFAMPPASSRA